MKKRLIAVVMGALLLLGGTGISARATDAETDQFLHRSNVVFVTDESGSMKQTDPNDSRYEAIRLFLGEMTNEGNYVGSVSFGEQLVDSSAITSIDGQAAKDALLADISDQEYSNYTNIGRGLIEAVDMLDEGRNPELDSAIILLTDGNTDMPNDDSYKESMELKAEAIERARNAGYKIYTICLNVNGAADSGEMKQIAQATGGEFEEVVTADDLNEVETMFNKLIFNSFEDMDFSNLELKFGGDGTVTTNFEIPGVGVEEINVLFQGSVLECELVDPNGNHYDGKNSETVYVDGANFLLEKVANPVGGSWQAVAYGDPDAVISLRLLYNSNFYVTARVDAPQEVHVGDKVKVVAQIGTSQGIETDTSRYSDMTATVKVNHGDKTDEYPMQIASEGFVYEMPVAEEGTYFISVTAANSSMESKTDTFEVSVNNESPVASAEEFKAHANLWPVVGGSASIDISTGAVDPEGEAVTYTIESTAFNEEDYTFDGKVLTVHKFSIPKGSFTIRAADPYGAYCTFDARFTSTNIGVLMAIAALIGLVIAIIVIILGVRAAMGKSLTGTLSVAMYDSSRRFPPQVKDHGRGKIPLGQFVMDPSIMPQGCVFQCDGGKRQVWFISKTPVYSDVSMGATKKLRISGDGMDIRISADEKMERGILVSFKSDKMDPMGMSY